MPQFSVDIDNELCKQLCNTFAGSKMTFTLTPFEIGLFVIQISCLII